MHKAAPWPLAWAFACVACGSSDNHPEVTNPRGVSAIETTTVSRCTLTEPHAPGTPVTAPVLAIAGGATGPRFFTEHAWWDARDQGDHALDPHAPLAWTGVGYLTLVRRALVLASTPSAPPRTLRPLPNGACDPALLELPSGAALLFIRTRGRCGENEDGGPVMYQRLDAAGNALGPALQLGRGDTTRDHVATLRARSDMGRVVLEYRDDDALEHFAVLGPDGRELFQGEGGDVACPRAGCVRLLAHTGSRPAGEADDDGNLRVEIVGERSSTFALPLAAERVDDLAVRGDRVLVRFAGPSEPEGGENFALIDVARREVVPVYDQEHRGIVLHWRELGAGATTRLYATATGFAIGGGDGSGGALVRRLDCPR